MNQTSAAILFINKGVGLIYNSVFPPPNSPRKVRKKCILFLAPPKWSLAKMQSRQIFQKSVHEQQKGDCIFKMNTKRRNVRVFLKIKLFSPLVLSTLFVRANI